MSNIHAGPLHCQVATVVNRCLPCFNEFCMVRKNKKNKKLINEAGLLKEAIRLGMIYGEKRGVVEFEPTDSVHLKVEYIYRLLVHDKLIQPLAKPDVSQKAMAHKLALWVARQLPEDHPLLRGQFT